MGIRFTKMHGLGNDYVYIDGFDQTVRDPARLARRVAERRFGVGSDGLILIQPPGEAGNHCRMEMYNADGSRAQMCGNGIRCVAKYVHDHRQAARDELRIETDDGLKTVTVHAGADGRADRVTVDMGPPRLRRREIPLVDGGDPDETAIGVPITIAGRPLLFTAVSMGNPHAVARVDSPAGAGLPPLEELPLAEWGPLVERHPWFPERTNVEFIRIRSPQEMDFRVWERGSGETLACGTGACAAVVAGSLNGWCGREVVVHLRGGDLKVRWDSASSEKQPSGSVFMTGPATEVFQGELPGEW